MWRSWCCFCGSIPGEYGFEDLHHKQDLLTVAAEYFPDAVDERTEVPTCPTCKQFIGDLQKFSVTASNSATMFSDLKGLELDDQALLEYRKDALGESGPVCMKSDPEDVEIIMRDDYWLEEEVAHAPVQVVEEILVEEEVSEEQEPVQQVARRTRKQTASFTCDECGQVCSSAIQLKRHQSKHTQEDAAPEQNISNSSDKSKPFVCNDCGKTWQTKGGLKEHMVLHSDERPFQCSKCTKSFKNLQRLKIHEDIHKDTAYICPLCGLQLNTKRTLTMHMVVHSEVKKFKCEYCGSEYKRAKALKAHLIIHTGMRPYSCPFCERTFVNGSNCRTHKRKAHPVELAALEATKTEDSVPTKFLPSINELRNNLQIQSNPNIVTIIPMSETDEELGVE